MKHGTPAHPKMHDLAQRIGMPLFAAVGIMETLWHYAGDFTPRGDIGRASNAAIARALDWRKKPDFLITSLVDAKWLDLIDGYGLIVHDWPDHAQEWVKKKLTRSKPQQDWLPVYGKSLYSVATDGRQKQDFVGPRARQGIGLGSGSVDSRGSAEGGEMRPEWDDQWNDFREKYQAAKPDLIDEDFIKAHHVWRVLDFYQRDDSILGIAARLSAGQWNDPQFIPKPEKYLREDRKRKVIPRLAQQPSRAQMESLKAMEIFKRGQA